LVWVISWLFIRKSIALEHAEAADVAGEKGLTAKGREGG
jgi:hypothetical protein